MQVILTIPKEFEDDWHKDRFADSLNRLCIDAHCLAGLYEKEVCRMLIDSFATATTVVKENDTAKLQGEWDMFQKNNNGVSLETVLFPTRKRFGL